MALTLYVDTDRWRAHQQSVIQRYPGIVPVCKGNGYGFGHERLADEATRFGSDVLAVGTTYEAARMKDFFGGDLLVLTPFRKDEEPVPLPDRAIRSVSSVEGVGLMRGARVVIEVMSSMKRHGVTEEDLPKLHSAIDEVRLEGFAIHLPLDRTDGSDAVEEVIGWMDRLRAARLPLDTMFVSHLGPDEFARLQQQFPRTNFRARIGTRLWLGDHTRHGVPGLDPGRHARSCKGDRFGYRQQKAAGDGWLVVVAGGTSHGVGLESPKALHGHDVARQGRGPCGAGDGEPEPLAVPVGRQAALVRGAAAHADVDPVRAGRGVGAEGRRGADRAAAAHDDDGGPYGRPLTSRKSCPSARPAGGLGHGTATARQRHDAAERDPGRGPHERRRGGTRPPRRISERQGRRAGAPLPERAQRSMSPSMNASTISRASSSKYCTGGDFMK